MRTLRQPLFGGTFAMYIAVRFRRDNAVFPTIYQMIIFALWAVFILVWLIAAFFSKKRLKSGGGHRVGLLRIGFAAGFIVFINVPVVHRWIQRESLAQPHSEALAIVGVLACALGIGLAIWARAYLGRNWGMPMTRKEDPELVTTGPYAYVRHPIYSGALLAVLGTMLATSVIWILLLVFSAAYFLYSAKKEEKLLLEQFPDRYPAYSKKTKMLIPFVL